MRDEIVYTSRITMCLPDWMWTSESIAVTFIDHQGFIRSLRMPYSAEHLVEPRPQALRGSEGSLCL